MSERERKSLDEALQDWRIVCLLRHGMSKFAQHCTAQVEAHYYLLTKRDHAN